MTRVRPSLSSGRGQPIAGWLTLVLVAACGERVDSTPRVPDGVAGEQPGPVVAGGQPDTDTVVAGGQSGTEGEGNLPYDSTDVVGDGEVARSFMQVGRLGPANLVRPFRHLYQEGRDGAPPTIALYHSSVFSSDLHFSVELPYREGQAELLLPDEAGVYLYETVDGAQVDKVAIAGHVGITPTGEGLRVDLEGIVLREGGGTTEEALGDGVITGQVEQVCFYLAIVPESPAVDGVPYPQHVQDETWSSPFCAPYRSEALK